MVSVLTPYLLSFFLAAGMGANDVANSMSSSVGSGLLPLRRALILAAFFEFLGALLGGGAVTRVLTHDIVDFAQLPTRTLTLGMLAILTTTSSWLLVASYKGCPVSTTHSMIGSFIGFGLVALGQKAIYWSMVAKMVISWFAAPTIAALLAYLGLKGLDQLVFKNIDPHRAARCVIPYCLALTLLCITLQFPYPWKPKSALCLALLVGTFCWWVARYEVLSTRLWPHLAPIERHFAMATLFSACAVAFAHGANDVSNAIAPLQVIEACCCRPTPRVILLAFGACSMVVGLSFFGRRVMTRVGEKIVPLSPHLSFLVECSTAVVVSLASMLGLSVSTTQCLVGAIFGVGIASFPEKVDRSVLFNIVLTWIITLPLGAGITVLIFKFLDAFLL